MTAQTFYSGDSSATECVMCAASGLALFYYNNWVHPASHSDASQAARRWSTAPLSQPTAMFSPAQSMADTGLGARKKATAGFVSPLSSAPSWTTTSSPSALTRKRPTRCSVPAVFEKANWSPAASSLLAPVDTSQTLIEPSSLALTSVAPSRNSTCVTVRLQRFAGNCEHDSACGLNLEERADSSVPRSRYFDRCISNGRSNMTGDRGLRAPMLVTAAKTLVSANLCAVSSLTQMPCSMSQMRTVLSLLPDARRLLSELKSRQVTMSLPSQHVSYNVTETSDR